MPTWFMFLLLLTYYNILRTKHTLGIFFGPPLLIEKKYLNLCFKID